jgi:hypothetical protein
MRFGSGAKKTGGCHVNQEIKIAQESSSYRCRMCPNPVRQVRENQKYCSPKCRRDALLARKQARQVLQEPKQLQPMDSAALLSAAQDTRDMHGLERLQLDPYLSARAACIEAELQITDWTKRLKERREVLHSLQEPPLDRSVQRLVRCECLTVPDTATAIGLSITDGCVGVAVYGKRR